MNTDLTKNVFNKADKRMNQDATGDEKNITIQMKYNSYQIKKTAFKPSFLFKTNFFLSPSVSK